ncbi:MAG TPA: cytochrome c [Marinobacter sp.]|nr:cytochrome c [Marinobacter sp.]
MRRHAVLAGALGLLASTPALSDELAQGKTVFIQEAQPSCTICHSLDDAGSSGAIGPDLDELKPSYQQVLAAVTTGVGVMPSFEASLTQAQIQAVARYVSQATGGPP